MSNLELKRKYKGFTTNPLISQSSKAIEQCVAPFMDSSVELLKIVSNKFNDKGRPEHITEWEEIECIITPSGSTSKTSSKDGNRTTTKYNVLFLSELKLQIDDVLRHKVFGVMKITDFDGHAPIGLTSAIATKLNAGWDISDGDMLRIKKTNVN